MNLLEMFKELSEKDKEEFIKEIINGINKLEEKEEKILIIT